MISLFRLTSAPFFTQHQKVFWNLYKSFSLNIISFWEFHNIVNRSDCVKNRQSRTTYSYFCRREIKKLKRFGMQPLQDGTRSPMLLLSEHYSSWFWFILVAILDHQHQLPKISDCLLIHIWCCLNMLTVCASLHSFQFQYFGRGKCFLLYLKLKLSFMGTDRSLPGPLDFGMHYW